MSVSGDYSAFLTHFSASRPRPRFVRDSTPSLAARSHSCRFAFLFFFFPFAATPRVERVCGACANSGINNVRNVTTAFCCQHTLTWFCVAFFFFFLFFFPFGFPSAFPASIVLGLRLDITVREPKKKKKQRLFFLLVSRIEPATLNSCRFAVAPFIVNRVVRSIPRSNAKTLPWDRICALFSFAAFFGSHGR
jgi:hypothetical protein